MRSNSELLSKTSTEVLLSFEEGRSQLQRTIESFQAMQLPIDNLVAASKNQADILGYLTQTIQNGLEGQTEMKLAVQEIREK
jgi:hypothetical protein